jgi:hypothetical protein
MRYVKTWGALATLLAVVGLLLPGSAQVSGQAGTRKLYMPTVRKLNTTTTRVFVPTVYRQNQIRSALFGVETGPNWFWDRVGQRESPSRSALVSNLGGKWVRIGHNASLTLGLSWRRSQPTRGGPIDFSEFSQVERVLRTAYDAQITPMVVVFDNPRWANPATSCGAISEDTFQDFAEFMRQVVRKYKQPPFNVHHWEIGNEPDVDPRLVGKDNGYGCWGDTADLDFYGGKHYGEMLKVVGRAIKEEDPTAKVLIGGLLLDTPNTTDLEKGKPENFLRGILEAGKTDPIGIRYNYFDIVPYHAYPSYGNAVADYSGAYGAWEVLGGIALGKPRFLKSIMAEYGVSKPLLLNETALRCPNRAPALLPFCISPTQAFYEAQADFLPQMMARTLSEGVEAVLWYNLEDPGWGHVGLLDSDRNPRPAYRAYQTLISQVAHATTAPVRVEYGAGFEAYRFQTGATIVDLVWSSDAQRRTLRVPQSQFVSAVGRDGQPITPVFQNGEAIVDVGFSSVYIRRRP